MKVAMFFQRNRKKRIFQSHFGLFVSSTFSDMQRERDIIGRIVLPILHKESEKEEINRNILREIDLRWGITNLMAQDGAAATICLEAIADCVPFVIGFIGARAGWVPPFEPIARHDEAFAATLPLGLTLTEIELRYAAHLVRQQDGPAFPVLVRCSNLSMALAPDEDNWEDRSTFLRWLEDDPFVEVIPYETVEMFVDRATAALRPMVVRYASMRADIRPARHVKATPVMARERELAALGKATRRNRPVLLYGKPGAGKSWLLHRWNEWHGGGRVREGRRMAIEGLIVNEEAVQSGTLRDRVFGSVLSQLQDAPGATLVLDHVESAFATPDHADLSWFPNRLPRKSSLVCATSLARLRDQAQALGWTICDLARIDGTTGARFARTYLASYAKVLTREQEDALACAPWIDDLRALSIVLNELRRWGDFEALDARLAELCALGDGADLLDAVIAGVQTALPGPWHRAAEDIATLLALSRSGLSGGLIQKAVQHAAGTQDVLPASLLSAIELALGPAVLRRADVIDIGHGAITQWAERQGHEAGLQRGIGALRAALEGHPDALLEAPGLCFAEGGEEALERLMHVPATVLALYGVGPSFLEGWLVRLSVEARECVTGAWCACVQSGKIGAIDVGTLGEMAARIGMEGSALALLEAADHRHHDDLRAFLARDEEALERLARMSGPETPVRTALFALTALANGYIRLDAPAEKRLLATARAIRRRGGEPGTQASIALMSGQIALGRADPRQAVRDFEAAESGARSVGDVQVLCRALERIAAAALELNRFRRARSAATETRDLAAGAGLTHFEELGFERGVEIEVRRANWSAAYALATAFLEKAHDGPLDAARAHRLLMRVERS